MSFTEHRSFFSTVSFEFGLASHKYRYENVPETEIITNIMSFLILIPNLVKLRPYKRLKLCLARVKLSEMTLRVTFKVVCDVTLHVAPPHGGVRYYPEVGLIGSQLFKLPTLMTVHLYIFIQESGQYGCCIMGNVGLNDSPVPWTK